jgi:polyphosphate kinase
MLARVKVPVGAGIPRFIRAGDGAQFVPLEDVVSHNLDLLFPAWRSTPVSGSESLATPTRNATRRRPTICSR